MLGRKVKNIILKNLLVFLFISVLVFTQGIQQVTSNQEWRQTSSLQITLEPGSPLYPPGETAEIHGILTFHSIPVQDIQITIKVLDPADILMDQFAVFTNFHGAFNQTFWIPFDAYHGRYVVYANTSYAGEDANATASFEVFYEIFLVETNKPEYCPGEDVVITFFNGYNDIVGCNGVPPYDIFTYPEMEPVYPQYIAFMVWYIGAGETQTFVWGQLNQFEGRSAEPGLYIVGARTIGLLDQDYAIFAIVTSGDLNHDGLIDIMDILLASTAYGSNEGDANWNPEADLAPPYGVINLCDLVTIAYHYGESW